ncbi:MAG: (Fe-S)-binding protein, partial [bacterium]|nr:(Fe-S)-binding protein [bacterium]
MFPISVGLLLLVGLAFFAYTVNNRLGLLKATDGKDERWKHLGDRIKGMFIFAFGQKRMMSTPRDFWAGLWHAFIFWGFCVISIRTLTLFGQGFDAHFHLPLLSGWLGEFYNLNKDIFTILVFVACVWFLVRRFFVKPDRISLSLEGIFILFTIMGLMVT